jgi:CheY-like chemotaxis protein
VILVVDDDEAIRQAVSEVLEHRGYIAARVGSGAGALAYLGSGKPVSLIVLDQNLRDMPGRQVREELQRDPKLAHIPVIVFSGVEPQGPMDGVVAFIRKSIDHPRKLFAFIDRACRKGRSGRA